MNPCGSTEAGVRLLLITWKFYSLCPRPQWAFQAWYNQYSAAVISTIKHKSFHLIVNVMAMTLNKHKGEMIHKLLWFIYLLWKLCTCWPNMSVYCQNQINQAQSSSHFNLNQRCHPHDQVRLAPINLRDSPTTSAPSSGKHDGWCRSRGSWNICQRRWWCTAKPPSLNPSTSLLS